MDRYLDQTNSAGYLQSGLAQGAAANAPMGNIKETPHTVAMREVLTMAHNLASETQAVISNLTERMFGSQPPTSIQGSTGQIQAVANGAADEALSMARELSRSLAVLRDTATRLESRL